MTGKKQLVSIVVPIFNEEATIPELLNRLGFVVSNSMIDYEVEVVVVDDGSSDSSIHLLRTACTEMPWLRVVGLSRNFGHQSAILAGISLAAGDAVVTMDGDLQDPPELIPVLVREWQRGFDVVYGVRRTRRGETFFKRTSAKLFYRFVNWLSDSELPRNVGDFRLVSRKVVDVLTGMPEKSLYLRGMVTWVGFPQASVEFDRDERFAGDTKYTIRKMLNLATDAILSFSERPLRIVTQLGALFTAAAFALSLVFVGALLFEAGPRSPGWLSTILAVLGLGGLQLISLGVIGQYVSRIYRETKGRPLFIVDVDRSENLG